MGVVKGFLKKFFALWLVICFSFVGWLLFCSLLVAVTESDEEMAPPPSYRAGMDRRRKSVFAESYEPGDDGPVEKVLLWSLNCRCYN